MEVTRGANRLIQEIRDMPNVSKEGKVALYDQLMNNRDVVRNYISGMGDLSYRSMAKTTAYAERVESRMQTLIDDLDKTQAEVRRLKRELKHKDHLLSYG